MITHFKELINKQKGDNEMMFLDIGANIGLVSAYVISRMPQITIHAFEPGLNQREFLVKTVENNSLKNKRRISQVKGGDNFSF